MCKKLLSLGILFSALHFGYAQPTPVVSQVNLVPVVDAINQMNENLLKGLNRIDEKLSDIQNKLSTLSKTEDYLLKIKASVSNIEGSVKNRDTTDGKTAAEAAQIYYDKLEFERRLSRDSLEEKLTNSIDRAKQEIKTREKDEKIKKLKFDDIEKERKNLESQIIEFGKEVATQKTLIQAVALQSNSGLPVDSRINLIKSSYDSLSLRRELLENKIIQFYKEL